MKKQLLLFSIGLLAYTAIMPLQAQEDVTESFIVNPTIEETHGVNSYQTMPDGWSVRNWVNNSESKVVKTISSNTFLQTWSGSGSNLSWDFYQDITGLPEGLYSLEAFAFSGYTDNATAKAVVMYVVTSPSGEVQVAPSMNSGSISTSIPTTDEYKVAVENFLVGADGILTIGFKSNQTVQNIWNGIDNFKLLYYGSDKKTAVIAQSQKLQSISAPDGYSSLITSYVTRVDNLGDDPTDEEVNALLEEGKTLYAEIEKAIANRETLYNLLDQADKLLTNQWPGAPALKTANDAAYSVYGGEVSATALNADFLKSISDLTSAIYAYRFTEPSSEASPIDVSFVLTNPNMELGNTGWTYTGTINNKQAIKQDGYGGVTDDNNLFTDTYALEMWGPTGSAPFNVTFSQKVKNLPSGVYTLKGAVSANDQASTGNLDGVYFFANDNTVPIEVKQNISSPDIYTVSTMVTDSIIEVGYKLVSSYANWCISDNFSLSYYAIDDATTFAKLIEKAKALQGKDMIPGALTALNNAITTAEGATADATSITALGQAISAANTAITEMSTFKAGDYKTLAAIESPDEIASFVLDRIEAADLALASAETNEIFTTLNTSLANDLAYAKYYISATEIASILGVSSAKTITDAQATTLETAKSGSSAEALATLKEAVAFAQKADVQAGSDVTSWITNPGFESSTFPAGWTNNSIGSNTAQAPLEITWFADNNLQGGFTGTKCAEKWIGSGNKLGDYSIQQTITGLPAGEYTISVWGKALQQALSTHIDETTAEEVFDAESDTINELKPVTGVYLFAQGEKTQISTPIVYDATLGEFTNVIRTNTNNSVTSSREPASQKFSVKCMVLTDLTFGVKTESTTASWIAFDNFTITCDKVYPVAIENVNAENTLHAYTEGGYIHVIGADEYTITNLTGQKVNTATQLAAGVYIVTSGAQSIKVAVK